MKITSHKFESNFKNILKDRTWSCLIYGPNFGLSSEIADKVISYFKSEQVSIVNFHSDDIEKTPSILINEAMNLSLFDSNKCIVIKGASNKLSPILESLEKKFKTDANAVDIFIIVVANELDAKSKLRMLYEKTESIIAVPCYEDDPRSLVSYIKTFFINNEIQADDNLCQVIASCSLGDRGILINALNVFLLYIGKSRTFSEKDVEKVFIDSTNVATDVLIDSILLKQTAKAIALHSGMIKNNKDSVAIVRSLILHILQIRSMKEKTIQGQAVSEVIKNSRVFFKRIENYKKQINQLRISQIDKMLQILFNTEIMLKIYSKYDEACNAILHQQIISCANCISN